MKISPPGDDISFHGCLGAIVIYSCLEEKEPEPSAPTHQDMWATRQRETAGETQEPCEGGGLKDRLIPG